MKYSTATIRLLFLAIFFFLLASGKSMLWLGLFAISLVVALIFGRFYCGYVCPINTLMIATEHLAKKLNLQTKSMPKWLNNAYLPWIFLILSITAIIISQKLLHIKLPIMLIWLVIGLAVTLRFQQAVFHNHLCPFGILQRTFGRLARLSKKVDADSCIGCKLCENVCPAEAIAVDIQSKKAVINSALCHQCTNCRQICPKDAVHYSK